MKILFVTHYALPHVGGIEVVVDQLGHTMADLGHDVTLVASLTGSSQRIETSGALQVRRVPAWNVLEERLHVPVPLFSPRLVPLLRSLVEDADIVHAHGLLYAGTWVALGWARRFGKPFVLTEHVGFVPYGSPTLNRIERIALDLAARAILPRVNAVVTINSKVTDWLSTFEPKSVPIHTIPNGVDCARFRPPTPYERSAARRSLGLPVDRPLVLFVGRFVAKKGIDLVLGLEGDGYDVVLCGAGEVTAAAPPFRVLHGIPQERMHEVYQAADVFVLPSHGEGFPVSIMEAMASGLPVIVVRDKTYASYVREDEVVQIESNARELNRTVSGLIEQLEVAASLGRRARERAVADFALAKSAERHLALYEELT